jgi:hypothetical protein
MTGQILLVVYNSFNFKIFLIPKRIILTISTYKRLTKTVNSYWEVCREKSSVAHEVVLNEVASRRISGRD